MTTPRKNIAIEDVTNEQTTTENPGVKSLFFMIFDRSTYSGLFKAGTVAAGIYLIGISQIAMTLYDKEIDAYTEKYRFEANTQHLLDQTDCKTLSNYQAECFIAKHKVKTSSESLSLLKTVTDAAKVGSLVCYIFSIFFFLSTPFARTAYSKKGT